MPGVILLNLTMADKMPSSPSEREDTLNTRLADVFVVAFIFLVLLMFYSGTFYKRRTNITALHLQLSELTMKQLRVTTVNQNADTNKLNKQIEELRSRLASLEQKNEEYRKHGGARIQEYRRQYETQMRREADSAFDRRCYALLKEKHISDLTLDDVELLKECGEPTSQPNPPN